MPRSRRRQKKPAPLKGISASLITKAPPEWSAGDKALFCRGYLQGFAGQPYRDVSDRPAVQARIDGLSPRVRPKAIARADRPLKAGWMAGRSERLRQRTNAAADS